MSKIKYTVLLLRPDYLADAFGQDTLLSHQTAKTPGAAARAAQDEAAANDGTGISRFTDYHILLTVEGHHDDITPR